MNMLCSVYSIETDIRSLAVRLYIVYRIGGDASVSVALRRRQSQHASSVSRHQYEVKLQTTDSRR